MSLNEAFLRISQEFERYDEIWEEAHEYALQRAREEGDVDPDIDYEIIEAWEKEYFIATCVNEGLDPYGLGYV